jgi:C1A family cysteine protease
MTKQLASRVGAFVVMWLLVAGLAGSVARAQTPASYDLRNVGGHNYVTSVKNQGNCASCWAFAAYASMESYILRTGGSQHNFSENNLKNRHGFVDGPCDGGTDSMTIAYLSRLAGPGREGDDPYHAWDDRATAPVTIPRQRFLHDAPLFDTATEIKDAVMDYGGLRACMYYDDAYFRSSDKTYYYQGTPQLNHAVTIVGWNDSKVTAGGPGAWLIKNSWGTTWGDSGYFWISYNDTAACKRGVSYQTQEANAVQDVYYYDTFGDVGESDMPYACNVFKTTKQEQLTAVGFYTQVDCAVYDLRIYDTWSSDFNRPSDLLASKTGAIDTGGFHVIDLDSLISLDANDDFVVYLMLAGGPQAIDYALPGYCNSTASAGESYYSYDGNSWTDLYTWNNTSNFSIKAYTIPEPVTMMLLGLGAVVLLRRRRPDGVV